MVTKLFKMMLATGFALTVALAFFGCDDSKAITKPTDSNLAGVWEFGDEINLSSEDSQRLASSMELFNDGTGIANISIEKSYNSEESIGLAFKWQLRDGNRLQITMNAEGTEVTEINEIELSGKGALLTFYYDGINSNKENPRKSLYKKKNSDIVNSYTFTDSRDGKKYKAVKIGFTTWMAENLNFEAEDSKCNGEGGKVYTWRDTVIVDSVTLSNSEVQANCKKYGRLYNWETSKKICPSGWHLPTNEEWDKLYRYADGIRSTKSPYSSETAGKYLKNKTSWKDYEGKSSNGMDSYGFSALPSGDYYSGKFGSVGYYGYWWSASDYDNIAYGRNMDSSDGAGWGRYYKTALFSVRCVQNEKKSTSQMEQQ